MRIKVVLFIAKVILIQCLLVTVDVTDTSLLDNGVHFLNNTVKSIVQFPSSLHQTFQTKIMRILSNNMPKFVVPPYMSSELILEEYNSGLNKEDVNLSIDQIIRKYGFNVEKHSVSTEDGYVLTMFRIPRNGTAVFLMHGLLSSSDDWVTSGPNHGIAFLLAADGFDVWIGNARGNKHSRHHLFLSPDADDQRERFWDFSWDEIGRYDLPAMIDYVLFNTGQSQLKYIGHSQGTTSFFVMCSMRPDYNQKISLMVALSPVAWMSRLKSPLVRVFATGPSIKMLQDIVKTFKAYEVFQRKYFMETIQNVLCSKEQLAAIFCSNVVFLLCGFDFDQINFSNLPTVFSHVPSGASSKQLLHYLQEVRSKHFRRYDYGDSKNMAMYGSPDPPNYPVELITAPVALFYSYSDWMSDVSDVKILTRRLPNLVEFYKIPFDKFNHLDFLWAKDIKLLVYKKLYQLLNTY